MEKVVGERFKRKEYRLHQFKFFFDLREDFKTAKAVTKKPTKFYLYELTFPNFL